MKHDEVGTTTQSARIYRLGTVRQFRGQALEIALGGIPEGRGATEAGARKEAGKSEEGKNEIRPRMTIVIGRDMRRQHVALTVGLVLLCQLAWSQSSPGKTGQQSPLKPDDIAIPIEGGGKIVIKNPHFIRIDLLNGYWPELTFTLQDNTPNWAGYKVQFQMAGFCKGELREWSQVVELLRGVVAYKETIDPYREQIEKGIFNWAVNGCVNEIVRAQIWSTRGRPQPIPIEEVAKHRDERVAASEAEEKSAGERRDKAQEELDRREALAAEAREKKDVAEAARRKRLAAEQKKKDAEFDARLAKDRAEEQARAAEERRKVRDVCSSIYQATADKRVGDLTVKEDQQVRACQGLGLYPPR